MAIASDTSSSPNFERIYWEKARKSFKDGRKDKDDEKKLDEFLKERASPQEAKELCKSMKKAAGEEYSPSLGGILEKIEIAMSVGDLAIKSAPESVGLAWMGIRLCLHSVADDFATFSIFGQAASDIVGIMISCAVFGRMYGPSRGLESFQEIHSQVTDRIPKIYTEILDFSFSVKKYMSRNKLFRIGKGILVQASAKFGGKIKAIRDHDTAMAEFARRAHEQLSDYYLRSGQESQKVMMGDLSDIKTKLELSIRVNQDYSDQVRVLVDEINKRKEMTPHDVAVKNFDENLKQLNVSSNQRDVYAAKLSRRSPPQTCTWIFEMDEFKTWYDADKSSLLWVSGAGGFGKSVLLASVIDELQTRSKATNSMVNYFFCGAGDDATKRADRILKHLIYEVYIRLKDKTTDVLEKANKLVSGFLKGKSTSKGDKDKDKLDSNEEYDFAEAYRGLEGLTGKSSFTIIDALDECIDRSDGLLTALRDLIGDSQSKLKIVVCSRPEPDIETSLEEFPRIKVEGNNGPDIRLNAQTELAKLPGWTSQERELACGRIVEKAGSYFRYVDLAVEFLKQPWQRPLKKHLEQLPEGLEAFYAQIIRKTDPAYLELLKTCLTWTILGYSRVTATEVIDAYSRIYATDNEDATVAIDDDDDDDDESPEEQPMGFEDLYVKQIRIAGSALLEVDSKSRIIQLRHNTVADYFLNAKSESISPPNADLCRNCQEHSDHRGQFVLSAKDGHLHMASLLLRHLMNGSFRQRFLIPHERTELKGTYPEEAETLGSSEEADPEHSSENVDASSSVDANASDVDPALAQLTEPKPDDDRNAEGPDPGDPNSASDVQTETDTDADPEENAQYFEDIEGDDPALKFRYEVNYLNYHLRQVEELWDPEDRKTEQWAEFEKLRDAFFIQESIYFRSWANLRNQERYSSTYWVDDTTTIHPIHVAAAQGLTSLVESLIKKGADLQALTDEGYTPLDFAIENYGRSQHDEKSRKHSLEILDLLMKNGSDPNKVIKRVGSSPFFRLFWRNPKIDVVQLFLDHGADAKAIEPGWSCGVLHYCCANCDDPKVFQALLAAGAEPDHEDKSGETSFHALMDRYRRNPETPVELVHLMLASGANINAEDKTSQRPLYELCGANNPKNAEIAEILLEHGADVMDDDVNKMTALHAACRFGATALVQVLLKKGAQLSAKDNGHRTPFYYACDAQSDETALTLIDHLDGSDQEVLKQQNKNQKTPLRKAAARGHHKLVEKLFDSLGSDLAMLHTVDSVKLQTPLHAAAANGHKAVVELLLTKGVDIHVEDKKGNTPLKACLDGWRDAQQENFEAVAQMLLEADPRKVTGTDLLHAAAMRGSLPMLNKLMDKGADPSLQDEHGWTAIQVARQYGNDEAVTLMSSRRAVTGIRPDALNNLIPKVLSVSEDKLEISKDTGPFEGSLLANHPVPAGIDGYYYEIEISAPTHPDDGTFPEIAFGLCPFTSARLRGWLPGRSFPKLPAWGYHGDDACLWEIPRKSYREYNDQSKNLPNYGHGDTIGCGLDIAKSSMWFTKNGELLEVSRTNLPPSFYAWTDVTGRLYPVIGITAPNVTVKVNFGNDLKRRPFRWAPGNENNSGIKVVAEEEALLPKMPLRRRTTTTLMDKLQDATVGLEQQSENGKIAATVEVIEIVGEQGDKAA